MENRYSFTRAWGAITAGIGWVIVIGAPVVCALIARFHVQAKTFPGLDPMLFIATATVAGAIAGLLVGGTLIVSGQLLRIAVDSLRVQTGIFERVDFLATRAESDSPGAGRRFSGLAGE